VNTKSQLVFLRACFQERFRAGPEKHSSLPLYFFLCTQLTTHKKVWSSNYTHFMETEFSYTPGRNIWGGVLLSFSFCSFFQICLLAFNYMKVSSDLSSRIPNSFTLVTLETKFSNRTWQPANFLYRLIAYLRGADKSLARSTKPIYFVWWWEYFVWC